LPPPFLTIVSALVGVVLGIRPPFEVEVLILSLILVWLLGLDAFSIYWEWEG
jgi:hypothetical protein